MGFDMAVFRCIIDTLKGQRNTFDYNYHDRVERHLTGLYAFWLVDGACLYVGKGNIHQRVRDHRTAEHNSTLERYFKAFSQRIEVSIVPLQNRSETEIEEFERRAIRFLRPVTNIKDNKN